MTQEDLSSLLSGIGLSVSALALAIAFWTLKADHERRKKQATIEYANQIREIWQKSKTIIEQALNKTVSRGSPISQKETTIIENTPELLTASMEILARLEHLAVGVNAGVFDASILYRMSGSHLIGIYDYMLEYIKMTRETPDNEFAYIEFGMLAEEFKRLKTVSRDPRKFGHVRLS
ncbi:DUF4760 domain-containing protein [Chondromyces apiculatus]|uniref:DUF4760 domain-containing protein n=1 Tax=Chondromyces apiculatus TaxID=51 RepID=UPI0009E090CB|nr:DUF4760 domain-containing protein [Chondromyces apiculatus]